jgi:LmbE family N-acetylglucosaminyl deacetylase
VAERLTLLAVLAHPDDESMGVGGVIAKYAAEGVEVSLVVATRGQRGRFHGHPQGDPRHPGADALARIDEAACIGCALERQQKIRITRRQSGALN